MGNLEKKLKTISVQRKDEDVIILDLHLLILAKAFGERNNVCTNNGCNGTSENPGCTNNSCDVPTIEWTMNIACTNNKCY